MFSFCTDPSLLPDWQWMACYLTTGKHMSIYVSVFTVLLLLAITAPAALAFGFGGAMAARSRIAPLSWLGKGYIAIVRGVPDIAFFLFFVIALDQAIEYLRHRVICPQGVQVTKWPASERWEPDSKNGSCVAVSRRAHHGLIKRAYSFIQHTIAQASPDVVFRHARL